MTPGRLSAAVLIAGAAVCLAIAFHIGTIGIASFRDWTILYVALPAGFGLLLLAALLLGPGGRAACAVSACAALVAVVIADAYLATTDQEPVRAARTDGDTRSVRDVVRDLRGEGRQAYPVLSGRTLLSAAPDGTLHSRIAIDGRETLPLGGIADALTVYCNQGGAYLIYSSDAHGFHNPPGLWERPQLDVAAVGDSFTHGACVPSERNMVAEVRARFPATLNLGMAGNGPLSELASIKEYLPQRRPRVVLWFYYEGNDVSKDLFIEREAALLVDYLGQGFVQGLEQQQPAIDDALIAEVERAYDTGPVEAAAPPPPVVRPLDVLLLRHLRDALGMSVGNADIPLFRRVMAEADRTVSSWGGRLYFVYLPGQARYLGLQIAQSGLRTRVLATVHDLGIPVIDVHEAFSDSPAPNQLFQGHFTAEGYRIAAEAILNRLHNDGFSPLP
ncbi:MAG: hypothetical protein NTY59_01230 [Alphaproteobacteria bacterium]|nr:hypothetical protein [Alphaproteobacteria bacterium]